MFISALLISFSALIYGALSRYVTPKTMRDHYDYIIAGGGTAGARLAWGLQGCGTVLLLEAGDKPPFFAPVPLLATLFKGTKWNWNYVTVPPEKSDLFAAYKGNVGYAPSGKVLGGSSVINWMVYYRGAKYDYDRWANEFGAKGWNFEEVLKYFKMDEKNHDKNLSDVYHGRSGNIDVSTFTWPPLTEAFIKAFQDAGYAYGDSNDDDQLGIYPTQATVNEKGEHVSVYNAFLEPICGADYLDISLNSLVERVILKNKKATGVQFIYEGNRYVVNADVEVIVSAGAIRSPQILMLSGIGPKKNLDKIGVKTLVDLPGVGENHQNHLIVTISLMMYNASKFIPKLNNFEGLVQYMLTSQGPFRQPAGAWTYHGFVKSSGAKRNNEAADFEMSSMMVKKLGGPGVFKPGLFEEYTEKIAATGIASPQAILGRPRSRGRIIIFDKDPNTKPIIYGNYLSDPEDMKRSICAYKKTMDIIRSPHIRKHGIRYHAAPFPLCKHLWKEGLVTEEKGHPPDKYLECVIRTMLGPMSHHGCTCRMGNESEPMAVVDSELRVRGVEGLRVVDMSVAPALHTGHTYPTAVMIAAKAADLVCKRRHGRIVQGSDC